MVGSQAIETYMMPIVESRIDIGICAAETMNGGVSENVYILIIANVYNCNIRCTYEQATYHLDTSCGVISRGAPSVCLC